jgi:TldD protein
MRLVDRLDMNRVSEMDPNTLRSGIRGVLRAALSDRESAAAIGLAASGGCARADGFARQPIVRMTNTNILPGKEDPDQILRSTAHGIYVRGLGGGQVNPATGDFVFGVTEAYLIEKGEITRPIRAAQLIGNGPDVLRMVDAVGNDFETWTGMCGKQGQSVPVSSGQPTVLVREMTVGGTAA